MEDNKDLYELMGDLRELGIGEDRVYFIISRPRLDKKTLLYSKDLYPDIKIILDSYNNSRERIELYDIKNDLLDKKYTIEFDPFFNNSLAERGILNRYITEIEIIIERKSTFILSYETLNPQKFMKNLSMALSPSSKIELFIDGTLMHSEPNANLKK